MVSIKKYVLSKRAEKDINEIVSYIYKDNQKSAVNVLRSIRSSCSLVGRMPLIGRTAEDVNSKDLHYLPVEKYSDYLIFYILIKNKPLIVRVLHAKRSIPTIMEKWYK